MMRRSMDRQLRNIALITLLLAALTIIAVVSPEHHRSTTNTVILAVAIMAVAGSTAALALGSVWLAVLRRDLREWRDARPGRRWIVSYYLAQEESVELRESGASLVFYSPNVETVRAGGLPCLIIDLKPRTQDKIEGRPLKGATVACAVRRSQGPWYWRKSETRAVEVAVDHEIASDAVGRWPDVWFSPALLTPTPGRYRIRWETRLPDGRIERPAKRYLIAAEGEAHVGTLTRAALAVRDLARHYRALE
jgi:hypothetical protein